MVSEVDGYIEEEIEINTYFLHLQIKTKLWDKIKYLIKTINRGKTEKIHENQIQFR